MIVEYVAAQRLPTATIADWITGFPTVVDPLDRFELTLLDTFDWRLHAARLRLEWRTGGTGDARLVLTRTGRESAAPRSAPCVTRPGMADSLPVGLRELLAERLEMRTLLPQARLAVERHVVRVLDDAGKTVVRLHHEALRCLPAEDGATRSGERLEDRVRIVPVKGYDEALRAVSDRLIGVPTLTPAGLDPWYEALGRSGRHPGDYESGVDVPLAHDEEASAATRRVLLHLLGAIEANEDGTRRDLDTEFLHDFRVAVRRTRSALSRVEGVLPEREVARFKREFAWLGAVTSPLRDTDVYLLALPTYRGAIPAVLVPALDGLERHLRMRRQTERRKLLRALDGKRLRRLLSEWRDFLEREDPEPRPTRAGQPILSVANRLIRRAHRRVLEDGGRITTETAPEVLHELRKTCKKLRYLMEFFQRLYPARRVRRAVRALKQLQSNLGDLQDLAVQTTQLMEIAEVLAREADGGGSTSLALGALVGELERRHLAARDAFGERFAAFAAKPTRRLFAKLFEKRKRTETST